MTSKSLEAVFVEMKKLLGNLLVSPKPFFLLLHLRGELELVLLMMFSSVWCVGLDDALSCLEHYIVHSLETPQHLLSEDSSYITLCKLVLCQSTRCALKMNLSLNTFVVCSSSLFEWSFLVVVAASEGCCCLDTKESWRRKEEWDANVILLVVLLSTQSQEGINCFFSSCSRLHDPWSLDPLFLISQHPHHHLMSYLSHWNTYLLKISPPPLFFVNLVSGLSLFFHVLSPRFPLWRMS